MTDNSAEKFSDNTLMQSVSEGNHQVLKLLFERYKRILFTFFFNIYHDVQVSEDLVQNTFMRIFKYRKKFLGTGEFKMWMFHIARNVSHDYYRKEGKNKYDDIESWNDHDMLSEQSEDRNIEQREELQILHRALQNLDNEKRELLTLSKLKEMKYKEIAMLLGITEGAVKVKVFRAMKALRDEYNHIMSRV